MNIAIAADHAGVDLKRQLVEFMEAEGHSVEDLGPHSKDSVDYPDYAHQVAEKVLAGEVTLAVLVCGTGVGMSMAANRHGGVRAVCCSDEFTARMSRAHNNANVLCLGARVVGTGTAEALVQAFVGTEFEGDRHARRVAKIERA